MQEQPLEFQFDNSYARLPSLFFSAVHPSPVIAPKKVVFNAVLAKSLGLNPQLLGADEGAAIFSGNIVPDGAQPLAQAYAGHQFGHFNMLGDGRALLLGEHITPTGERFDIQFKGSGRTPYSRRGDGLAALGPMLREYIISEAMHGLGIPTTRSLAVVTTGEPVYRETELPGAILTRIASSHLRVGTFQFAAQFGALDDVRALADYTIQRHFSEISLMDEQRYLLLLREVVKRQASLIAKWQLVGFIHGVMNTDNMSICGETIDYGPCAFMDAYDAETVFSSIDAKGRYAYCNQPYIGAWNLARLAESILPLIHSDEEQSITIAREEIEKFSELYYQQWVAGMRSKLGIFNEEQEDRALFEELLSVMQAHHADFTNTFLDLTFDRFEGSVMYSSAAFVAWHERWQARRGRQTEGAESSRECMCSSNPAVIPRNHRVEAALEAAVKHADYSVLEQLLAVLGNPYAHTPEQAEYAVVPVACEQPYQTYCGT